jgi:NADH dehydrogenase
MHLSQAAKRRLENLGVEVRLGQSVDHIDDDGVVVGGERIASKTVILTAGRCSLTGGQVVANRDGSRRSSTRSKRPHSLGYPEIFA